MTRYMVDSRTIWVLLIFGCCSILLAGASAVFTVQAKGKIKQAQVIVQRADSIIADWTKRGCAPRSP